MNPTSVPLTFKTIDLILHSDICVDFRLDSFVASFGTADKFYAEGGADKYLQWLQAKIEKDPRTAVHAWLDGEIVGQMEMGLRRDDPTKGHVNLFYLRKDKRGCGLSQYLDQYAQDYFKSLGLSSALLAVSPTNGRALAYYKKMNWVDLGQNPEHPEIHMMEKKF